MDGHSVSYIIRLFTSLNTKKLTLMTDYPTPLAAQSLYTVLIPSYFDSLLPIIVPDLLAKESCRYGS